MKIKLNKLNAPLFDVGVVHLQVGKLRGRKLDLMRVIVLAPT